MERYWINSGGEGFFEKLDFCPSFESNVGNYDLFVTQELFGTGGMNLREIFISQKLYQLLKSNKINGLKYYPQAN